MGLKMVVTENAPLAAMTTFRIGGNASCLCQPENRDDLSRAAEMAAGAGLPLLPLGGGSNILVADGGVDAVVVRPVFGGAFGRIERIDRDGLLWRVGAGAPLSAFVAATLAAGAAGLEALAGIPGRVGGAVRMNAGAWGCSVGEYVIEAEIFDPLRGEIRVLAGDELEFGYRRSFLSPGGMIALGFVFRFGEISGCETVEARALEYRSRKMATQPIRELSAGCVFKNPPGDSAGLLLDRAGCKGMREGRAAVSDLHANFIVNRGGAGSADVLRLIDRMRRAVRDAHGIDLETELVLWGTA